jgi:acetoin utilization deacetylase AcuC-like enzyme
LALLELSNRFDPALVIYLAGADPFAGDRLGRLKLSANGLESRDRRVFDWCFDRSLPVAFVMAGGYGRQIEKTVQIQLTTYSVALSYWQRWQLQRSTPARLSDAAF